MIQVSNIADKFVLQVHEPFGSYQNEAGATVEGFTLRKFKSFTENIQDGTIKVDLFSPGGDVFEAFALYDYVRSLPQRVECDIVGSSASAATIFASACDKVRISENSKYLVHFSSSRVEGNKEDFKDSYDQLVEIDNQIVNAYMKKTGKQAQVLNELMSKNKWQTAQEALDWGFVDEIISNQNKITNMEPEEIKKPDEEKVVDATPEELMEENEMLKTKLTELEAKLAEYEMEQVEALENEVEAIVENAVKAGKIKAEAKESIKVFGITNKVAMMTMIENIVVPTAKLSDVVDPAPAPVALNKETFMKAFKSGEYKNNLDKAREDFKKVYGVNPQF